MHISRVAPFALLAAIAPGVFSQGVVIEGASILDGLGSPSRLVNVRFEAGRITAVGESVEKKATDRIVSGSGLVLAPGFIDVHNHSDGGLAGDPGASTQVSQGITTLVAGVDGSSAPSIRAWLAQRRANPSAVNVATFIGHGTVRSEAMGRNYARTASSAETAKMAALVERAMGEGAFGLSTGLEYELGSYSTTGEIIELAKAVAKFHGIYVSHIRDESELAFDSFRELIRIGEEAAIPVHISHIKLGSTGVWGKSKEAVQLIAGARARGLDITADIYPYDAWSSSITVMVANKKYFDPPSVRQALELVGGPQNVTIINCQSHRDFEFKTLEQIAAMRGISTVNAFILIVRDGGASVVGNAMKEPDLREFFIQPWVMVASDGGIGMRHPRSAGTFPRVLGRYVRESQWVSLAEAVRKMTSFPADRMGFTDRGVIRPGAVADLVLFDPEHVADQSTFERPAKLSVGIEQVYVSGKLVWNGHSATGELPGKVLTKLNPGGK